jgi:multiple sugar transport system substrate-binding protein
MILFKRRLQTNMGKKILIIFAVLVFASCVAFASTKEKGAAEKPEKLTIVVYEPVEAKGMAEFGKIFKEKYDIEVEVFTVPWANLHEKIIADLTAQTGTYDLIAIPGLWSLEFIYAGYIEPLDTYWENPDYPSFDIEDYPQDIVNLVADEDHVYWIPHHATTQILFY